MKNIVSHSSLMLKTLPKSLTHDLTFYFVEMVMSIFSWVGSTWFTLIRLRFTPETFWGPVTRTKFLSIMSTIMHILPASRPAILTHILPTSIASNFDPPHLDWEYPSLYFTDWQLKRFWSCNVICIILSLSHRPSIAPLPMQGVG